MTPEVFDHYSPFCLIIGGVMGLLFASFLERCLRHLEQRPPDQRQQELEVRLGELHQRFQSGAWLSWAMVTFGALWMWQLA